VPLQDVARKGWKPIRPCICVTEPCPCDDLDDIIVWLPSVKKAAKRTGDDGIDSYSVEPDERVLVELQIPMTLTQLRQLKEWADREDGSAGEGSGDGEVTAAAAPVGTAGAAVAAFEVGYALGTKIDEAAGLSDKISDWAAENIPWPF
jgi:hypothetical protein